MSVTSEKAQAALDAWLQADIDLASGKTVKMNGRELTLADSDEIKKSIAYWERRIERLQNRRVSNMAARAVFNG